MVAISNLFDTVGRLDFRNMGPFINNVEDF